MFDLKENFTLRLRYRPELKRNISLRGRPGVPPRAIFAWWGGDPRAAAPSGPFLARWDEMQRSAPQKILCRTSGARVHENRHPGLTRLLRNSVSPLAARC